MSLPRLVAIKHSIRRDIVSFHNHLQSKVYLITEYIWSHEPDLGGLTYFYYVNFAMGVIIGV